MKIYEIELTNDLDTKSCLVRAVSVDVAKKKAEKKFDGFYVYIIREIIDLLDVIK